jgi:Ca2+-binding RTX toxin-like protein
MGDATALPDGGTAVSKFYGASSGSDTITGTAGNDLLTAAGGDTMAGGSGDDTYVVTSLGDRIVEKAGGGIDTVTTWIDGFVLPAEVENLTLTGTGWNSITGNALGNRMTGNESANTIDGKGGADLLTGGGNDIFVIAKGEGGDVVTDFQPHGGGAGDTLLLKGFGAGATLTNSGNVFTITAADGSTEQVTLQGITHLGSSDYLFG